MIIDFISTWHIYLVTVCTTLSLSFLFRFVFFKAFIPFKKDREGTAKLWLVVGAINALYGLLIGFAVFSAWEIFVKFNN